MNWTPTLNADKAPLYLGIADAIERDVDCGVLEIGARLPPQRELAYRLSVSVGTVTRAYEEAERRGLVTAHVGRGSFIAGCNATDRPDDVIDLSINQPPLDRANAELAITLRDFARRGIGDELTGYAPPVGTESARKAGSRWMAWSGRVTDAPWSRVACTVGAQQAMDQAIAALTARGEPLLCEALTYWGAKAQARHHGNPLHGIAMDDEGLIPDAIEEAVAKTGARVLYCTPTLQNPTAAVMSMARRRQIAKLARRLDLQLIEDDVYAHYASDLGLEPLVNLIPERTIYITSLSKAVLPGLRAGYLLAPDDHVFAQIAEGLRATTCTFPGLSGAIAAEWIDRGRAQELAEAARLEMQRRTSVALAQLEGAVRAPSSVASLHLWLPMNEVACQRATMRASERGLRLLPVDTPRIDAAAPHGLRIGIGAPPSAGALDRALNVLRDSLRSEENTHDRAMV